MVRPSFTALDKTRIYDVAAVADWIISSIPCPVDGYEKSAPQVIDAVCWAIRRNGVPAHVGLAAMYSVFGRSFASPAGPFEKIRKLRSAEIYSDAIAALHDYRSNHKEFHPTWSAVEYAVRTSSQGLADDGQLTVFLSTRGWKEFGAAMVGLLPAKLQSEIESAAIDAIESSMGMSRRGRVVSAMVRSHLDRLQMLHTIYRDAQNERLARLDRNHPEAVRFRLRYFLGMASRSGSLGDLYRRYRGYEASHLRLRGYVEMNTDLANRNAPHRLDMRAPAENEGGPSHHRLPADAGLRDTDLGVYAPCIARLTAEIPARFP